MMVDKNGVEIQTGQIVEIVGAFFKNDNGLYFVDSSPGDPSWCGSDYSLKKISKAGKISKAKYNICFWPIGVFVSDRVKAAKARAWNREHAQIEVKAIEDMSEVSAHFQAKADGLRARIKREVWDFGKDAECVKKDQAILAHYETVVKGIHDSVHAQNREGTPA